jgi:hypothetical protein
MAVRWKEEALMTLWHLLVLLICAGIGLYAINRFVPMDAKIKQILNVVVVLVVVFVLLEAFGVIDVLRSTDVGPKRH